MAAKIRHDALLFGESQSRILVSLPDSNLKEFEKISSKREVPFSMVGKVGGDRLTLKSDGDTLIDVEIKLLHDHWRKALSEKIAEKLII